MSGDTADYVSGLRPRMPRVVYISVDPDTLARWSAVEVKSHTGSGP